MEWSEVERSQPRLAELGRERLIDPGVVLVATTRRDGTPRLSPVEPWIMDGAIWFSMMWGSTKASDLARDPRLLVHNVVASKDGQDGEFKVRGVARNEDRLGVQRRYAAQVAEALGWNPEPGRFHLFSVGIEHITYLRYDAPTGDQYGLTWPPAREFIRRATSATSVGPPQPRPDILVPD